MILGEPPKGVSLLDRHGFRAGLRMQLRTRLRGWRRIGVSGLDLRIKTLARAGIRIGARGLGRRNALTLRRHVVPIPDAGPRAARNIISMHTY